MCPGFFHGFLFPGSHMTVVITAMAMQIRVKRRNACRVPNRVQPNPHVERKDEPAQVHGEVDQRRASPGDGARRDPP